jgi:hypothetical protein
MHFRRAIVCAIIFLAWAGSWAGLLNAQAARTPWITGYFSANNAILSPANVAWSKYTHVIDFAASTDGSQLIPYYIKSAAETNALIVNGRASNVRVLVCIKDNDGNYNYFGQATSSAAAVQTFVNSIVAFVTNPLGLNPNHDPSGLTFDGVDIDWEKNVNVTQYEKFLSVLRPALDQALGRHSLITMAGNAANSQVAADSTAVPASISYGAFDQVNIMCYDFDWGSSYAWYVNPLFQDGNLSVNTCDWDANTFFAKADPSKLGIGFPFYGRRWTGAKLALQPASWNAASTFNYRDLVTDSVRWGLDPTAGHDRSYDQMYKANYLSLVNLNEFDSYTDYQAVDDLVQWVKRRAFGGYMTYNMEAEYLGGIGSIGAQDALAYPLTTELYSAIYTGICHGRFGGCVSLKRRSGQITSQ